MKKIEFQNISFDAIICLNANLPEKSLFDSLESTIIIAADGAAFKLCDIGVRCDLVIGDLDSFESHPGSDNFFGKIIKVIDQESNDFEKILKYCIENQLTNLLVTGMHGGELEHTLNNQSVLLRYSRFLNLCVFDSERYGMLIQSDISFECKTGEIISIIPMPIAKISSKNLFWELSEHLLELGVNEGARNKSTDRYVEILLHQGSYMLFIDSRAPQCPIFI